MTRIVLIDDHKLFRAGLKALLSTEEDLTVAAEATTGQEGLEAVERFRCDLVVLDFNLPDVEGPMLARRIRMRFPGLPILLLSRYEDPERVRQAMEVGCNGYLVKSADEEEFLTALRVVASGGIYVHPAVARALLGGRPAGPELSSRELTVIRYVARGLSNPEIAQRLLVSLGTVKRDLSLLYERFSVTDRAQLVAEAMAHGLVEPPEAP